MDGRKIDKPGRKQPSEEERMDDPNRTAQDAYLENMKAIQDALRSLRVGLKAHRKQAQADPLNWGYPGALSYVLDLVTQAAKFIRNEKE